MSDFVNRLVSGQLVTPLPSAAKANSAAAPAPQHNGSFWTGADGNVYVAGSQGTHSAGRADANTNNYWTSRGFTSQADPNAPRPQADAPSNPNNTRASSGSNNSILIDKSKDDLALQNAGLAANDAQTQGAVDKISKNLSSILGGYDTETANNVKNHADQSDNNQNQFQTSKQTALVNAASGRQGLLGTLGSIGALSGDSLRLANNAVQHGANEDLSNASGTYASNQSGLDTSLNSYMAANDTRRRNANTGAENETINARNSGAVAKQNFYTAIANDYSAQGDGGQATNYTKMAADLYPEIARTGSPANTLTPQTAAYTPSTLANYLARGNATVNTSAPSPTASGFQIPGLSASTKKLSDTGVA